MDVAYIADVEDRTMCSTQFDVDSKNFFFDRFVSCLMILHICGVRLLRGCVSIVCTYVLPPRFVRDVSTRKVIDFKRPGRGSRRHFGLKFGIHELQTPSRGVCWCTPVSISARKTRGKIVQMEKAM